MGGIQMQTRGPIYLQPNTQLIRLLQFDFLKTLLLLDQSKKPIKYTPHIQVITNGGKGKSRFVHNGIKERKKP